jgi:spermidine synthase
LDTKEWLKTHRRQVMQKLEWLQDEPVDIVWERCSALHRIMICREGRTIRMYFAGPQVTNEEPDMSGAMSALKLSDPFDLSPTPYNQAMMLSLLWQPNPRRIYMAGFAGGRIPLVFYHYFPEVVIESTDIDEAVGQLAEQFFGIEFDERQRLYIQDGREFLEQRKETVPYDFIFIDVFRGLGFSPPHLATADFYEVCKRNLLAEGVVAVNVLDNDPDFGERVAAIASSFKHVYVLHDRTVVLFGANAPLPNRNEILKRAQALQDQHHFSFPFVSRAAALRPLNRDDAG